MNFSDRYKEELDMTHIADDEEENKTSDMDMAMKFQEELRARALKQLKNDTATLADAFISAAELFYDRLKGKLPYSKITMLVLKFYDKLGGD